MAAARIAEVAGVDSFVKADDKNKAHKFDRSLGQHLFVQPIEIMAPCRAGKHNANIKDEPIAVVPPRHLIQVLSPKPEPVKLKP